MLRLVEAFAELLAAEVTREVLLVHVHHADVRGYRALGGEQLVAVGAHPLAVKLRVGSQWWGGRETSRDSLQHSSTSRTIITQHQSTSTV